MPVAFAVALFLIAGIHGWQEWHERHTGVVEQVKGVCISLDDNGICVPIDVDEEE